jgi:hypothetical protein
MPQCIPTHHNKGKNPKSWWSYLLYSNWCKQIMMYEGEKCFSNVLHMQADYFIFEICMIMQYDVGK